MKNIMISIFLLSFSALSHADDLSNCKNSYTKALKTLVQLQSGASVDEKAFYSDAKAAISSCEKYYSKIKDIHASRMLSSGAKVCIQKNEQNSSLAPAACMVNVLEILGNLDMLANL